MILNVIKIKRVGVNTMRVCWFKFKIELVNWHDENKHLERNSYLKISINHAELVDGLNLLKELKEIFQDDDIY